jgi:nucleoprotein TPR
MTQTDAQAKQDHYKLLPLEFDVQRLQSEIEALQTHSKWLEQELRTKCEELSNLKMINATETAKLNGQLSLAVSEKESMEMELNNLRRAVEELQKKNGLLSREVCQAKQEAVDAKTSMEEELVSSRRVADLQNQQLERLQQRYDGMAKRLQALKDLAEQAEHDNDNQWREQEQKLQAASKRILAEQAKEYQQKIAEMQDRINESNHRCKKAEDELLRIQSPSVLRALPLPIAGRITGEEGTDEEPLNLTDLYNRLAQTEDELNAEVTRRTKVEIRFSRLEAEIEASAPIFQQQRHECEAARGRVEEYKKRAENALNDAAAARNEARMLQAEMLRLKRKNVELTDDSKELAKQIQEMLISRSSGVDNPAVPQTVAQMQTANARILKEYRELKRSYEELEEKLKSDDKAREIEQFQEELESLRADRKRQESFVTSIVQQRDLYRALVMKTDSTILGKDDESTALEIVKRQSVHSNALQEENKKIHSELTQAKAQLDSINRDNEIAAERLQRYEALNGELISTVDRLTLEVSSSKAAAARSDADASYHKDKANRSEESHQRSREEINQVMSSKNRLMELNAELEHAVSKANSEVSKMDSELRQVVSKLHLAVAQSDAAKAAEKRISEEAAQLRSELSRQGTMIESIQRIENSLASRTNSEIESYKAEIEALKEKISVMEAKSFAEAEDLNGKIADLELKIRELEASRANSAKAVLDAKNESVESLKKMEEAIKKTAMLESQLKAAKKRLGDTNDDKDTEAEIRSKLASITADLESSTKQVEKWKERAATYAKMAKDSEYAIEQMSKATNHAKKERDEELRKLRQELERSNVEMKKRKEVIAELTNDLSTQRSEREIAVNEIRNQVSALKVDVEKYQKAAEDAEQRCKGVQDELNAFRIDLSEAQSNYERELELHASARSDLRKAREDCEKQIMLRQSAEHTASIVKEEFERLQASWDDGKSKHQEEMKILQRSLEDSRAQNSLLHSQLEKITEQIDRMRTVRTEGASGEDSKDEEIFGEDEISSLRRTVSELRELVHFVRSEKDVIQAQLDAARRATERERTKASIAQRNLEDARAELNVAQDVSNEKAADANVLSEKLKSIEEQCRLLNDSNAHLQQQVLGLQKKLNVVNDELQKSQEALKPAEKLVRELKSDKVALQAGKESAVKEVEDWKNRVQSMVARFNQVEPEEHTKLAKKAEELEKQVKDLQSKKQEAESETKRIRGLASRASTQLTQNKQLVENHKKTIAKLRLEKEELEKSQKEGASQKDMDDLKGVMSKMENERKNEAALLKGANEMNEMLRDRLRKFQKTIQALEKEKTDLSDQLGEAKTKITIGNTTKRTTVDTMHDQADRSPPTAATLELNAPLSAQAKSGAQHDEKIVVVVPPVQFKRKEELASPAAKVTETVAPKIPQGGFKFGPSEITIAAQLIAKPMESEKKPSVVVPKKRPAEPSNEDLTVKKKPFVAPVPTQAAIETGRRHEAGDRDSPSLKAPSLKGSPMSSNAAERRSSGEIKEMSMKEKLLEKKRRLMDKLKKKAQEGNLVQESAKSPQRSEERESKDKDSGSSAQTSSSIPVPSSLSPQGKPLDLNAPNVKSILDKKHVEGGNVQVDEIKTEKDAISTDKEFNDMPVTTTNPFVTAAATSLLFGSGGGAKPATFGNVFGSGGTTPAFGQTSSFGSGTSYGFGITPSSGEPSIFESIQKPEDVTGVSGGSSLLNLKPPGSSSVPQKFSFGASNNITLPTPATSSPSQGDLFNAFSSSFGGTSAVKAGITAAGGKPLFAKEEVQEESKNVEEAEVKDDDEEGEMKESEEK